MEISYNSKIATIGLNPSNREFLDVEGKELDKELRRLQTLNSLGIQNWSEIKEEHINVIIDACQCYFENNPYNGWFRILDDLISGTSTSYYNRQIKLVI